MSPIAGQSGLDSFCFVEIPWLVRGLEHILKLAQLALHLPGDIFSWATDLQVDPGPVP